MKRVSKSLLLFCAVNVFVGCAKDDSTKDDQATEGEKGVITENIAKAGIAWGDWWITEAGGSGKSPQDAAGVAGDGDFKNKYRCKSCHGWDLLGTKGGYSANAKGDANKRVASFALASKTIEAEEFFEAESRVKLESVAWAQHDPKTMPDFTGSTLANNKLTEQQINNFVEFVNNGPKITDYAEITPGVSGKSNPTYKFINADVTNGKALYVKHCETCHGADGKAAEKFVMGTFFRSAGKYSEGFHKILYGNNGTKMTRKAQGNLNGEQARDILSYIQANDKIFVD